MWYIYLTVILLCNFEIQSKSKWGGHFGRCYTPEKLVVDNQSQFLTELFFHLLCYVLYINRIVCIVCQY